MSGENSPPEREVLRPTGEVTPVSNVPGIVKDTVTGLGVPETTRDYSLEGPAPAYTWEKGSSTFADDTGREYPSVGGDAPSARNVPGHRDYQEPQAPILKERIEENPSPIPELPEPPSDHEEVPPANHPHPTPAATEVSTPEPTAEEYHADNVPFGSGNPSKAPPTDASPSPIADIPFHTRLSGGIPAPVELLQPEAPTTVPAEPAVTSPQPTEGPSSWQQRWADVEKTLDGDLRDRFVAASNRLLTHTQYSDRLTNDPHELERVTALRAKEVLNTPKYTNYGQGSPSDASRHFETDQARKQLAAEATNSNELANALFQDDVLDIGSKNSNEAVQLVERLNNQWPELTQRFANAKAAGQDLTAANVLRQAVGLEPGQTAPPPDTNPSPPTVAEHKGLIGRFIDRFRHHEQPNPAEATAGPEETQDVPPGYKNLAQKTLDLIGTGKDKVMRSDRAMFVLGGLAGVPVGMVASRLGLASETVQSNLYWITAGAELAKLGILAHINRGRVAQAEAGDTDREKVAKGSLFKGFAVGGLVGALSGAEQAIISGAVHGAPNFQEHTMPTLEHQAAAEVPQVEHAAQHWVEQQVHDFQNPPTQASHPNPIPTPPTGEVATPPPHAVEAPQPAPVHHPEIHIGNQGDSFDSAFQRFLDTDDGKNLLGFDHPGWVNPDNGVTQQEVLAAMVEDYAQQNGHDVAHVDPNSAFSLTSGDPNAQSLDLTPEQLENLRRVAQTNLVGQFLSMQPTLGLTGQR